MNALPCFSGKPSRVSLFAGAREMAVIFEEEGCLLS
nr:MAG TPA: hypothetical protein [Caudoviricetes sp.]